MRREKRELIQKEREEAVARWVVSSPRDSGRGVREVEWKRMSTLDTHTRLLVFISYVSFLFLAESS